MKREEKIGIVTLHAITNYGGILQCYALQTVLQRMGYKVEKLELSMWKKPLTKLQKILYYPYRIFKRKVLNQQCVIKLEQHQYENAMLRYNRAKYTIPFINAHINRKNVFSYAELDSKEYYALVVGSDQIWRPQYARNANADIRDAFLRYAKEWDVKRIAYAASFGTDECEYSEAEMRDCGELLKRFDAVSVREKSGIELCRQLGRIDAIQVIDPTLLLSKEDYSKLVPIDYPKSNGDLMCYVLDKSEKTQSIIDYVSQKEQLQPFEVIAQSSIEDSNKEDFYQPPVEKWLRGFMDAKFVITDSFHACVFSIIFGKPFIAIANPQRGIARYQTLLKMFSIENRLVNTFDKEQIDEILRTDFAPNKENLKEEKTIAQTFLSNYLMNK